VFASPRSLANARSLLSSTEARAPAFGRSAPLSEDAGRDLVADRLGRHAEQRRDFCGSEVLRIHPLALPGASSFRVTRCRRPHRMNEHTSSSSCSISPTSSSGGRLNDSSPYISRPWASRLRTSVENSRNASGIVRPAGARRATATQLARGRRERNGRGSRNRAATPFVASIALIAVAEPESRMRNGAAARESDLAKCRPTPERWRQSVALAAQYPQGCR
jgi:hypothetical protein